MEAIGIIHTPFATKDECPIQPSYDSDTTARIEVFDEYVEGLKDIEIFSHIYLLYLLNHAGTIKLVRATFLDDIPHGIYASRHPCRPNGIGLSIVKLNARKENILFVQGVDILDKTPLLDIKPYIPKYDSIPFASEGWTRSKRWREKPKGRE